MKIFTLKRMAALLVLTTLIALTNFKANATLNLGTVKIPVTTPVATAATSIGSTSFQANWNSVEGVDGYLLYVYTKTGRLLIKTYVANYNPKPVPGAKIKHFKVSGLDMNTTYYYVVNAVIGMEASPLSNEISVTTLLTAPEPPVATEASNITTNSFQANWEVVPGATGYEVILVDDDGQSNVQINGNVEGADATSLNITGLNPDNSYSYFVKAINPQGTSASSNRIEVHTFGIPAAPVATEASNITTNSFQANWEATPGATGYEVTLLNDDEQDYVQIDGDLDGGDVTSLNITGLTFGTQYSYYVKAVNDQGMSAFSNRVSANTFGIPDAPVATAASNITTSSFQANWEATPGATGYLLTVGNDFEHDYVLVDEAIADGDITSFEVTGLDPDTPYSYLVKAVNDEGTSGNSNMISLRTLTYKSLILSANPAEGGIVSGDGTFDKGTPVIATATVNRGYVFVNWTENGLEVSTEPSYNFTLNTNRTLVANFRLTTGVQDNFRNHIKVWPNPISTLVHISEIPAGSTIQITSLLGRVEMEKMDCKSMETLNLAWLNNGIYILTLNNEQGRYSQKIIKK